ncbi:MAG: hypothetical protein O7F08_11560 [Deltaproteobacteria bacterium]|nr:hypothetical protein [Deltaproteobacteria bacterium]
MVAAQALRESVKGGHLPESPHGKLEELFEGVWFVRGGIKMPMRMPMKIGRAMTVVRGEDGLTIFNSIRLTEEGFAELESLGEVKHVVRLAGFHGRDDGFYRDRYGARIYAVEGQRYIRGMDPEKARLDPYMEPDEWLTEESALPIADARLKVFSTANPPEAVCLMERHGGILVAGDSLQHTPEPDEFYNWPAKIMMKRFGFLKPYNVGPGWLQFAHPTFSDVRSILDLEFEHVLPAHGAAVVGDAKKRYRPAIDGELKGCHT